MTPTTANTQKRFTFTPLAKGWYRFNFTCEKTKHPKVFLWDYIKKLSNNAKKQQPQALVLPNITTIILRYDNRWKCPYCKAKNHGGMFKTDVKCVSCKRQFFADKQEPASSGGFTQPKYPYSYSFDEIL